jgi:flavin-dependent dehydrogenase
VSQIFDAVVIGAGPAGSCTAITLALAGWSVALIEKQEFPRRKVCGECIAASNLPLLDTLGIGDEFVRIAGAELREVALMSGSHVICAHLPEAQHPMHRFGRALGRESLDLLLLQRAARCGVQVLQPLRVTGVVESADRYVTQVVDQTRRTTFELHSRVAVRAQGSWQPLPGERERRRTNRAASDLFAFKANFKSADLSEGLLAVVSFTGGYGGMVVADAQTTTLAFCVRGDALTRYRAEFPADTAGESMQLALLEECRGVRDSIGGATRFEPWLAAGPLAPGIRVHQSLDGPFLVGNAAGEAHPIIGEGMSMAMQSGWLLGRLMSNASHRLLSPPASRADRHAFAVRYSTAWRRAFLRRLRLAAVFAHAAMRPAIAVQFVPLLNRWPSLITSAAGFSGKTRFISSQPLPELRIETFRRIPNAHS